MSTRDTSTWSDTRLIAGREVDEKLRSRSFLLSLAFFLAIVAASIVLPALLFDGGPAERDVAVVGPQAAALVDAVPPDELELTVTSAADTAEAVALVEDGDVDAAVEVGEQGVVVTGLTDVPGDLSEALARVTQLSSLQEALTTAGVPADSVEQLLATPPVQERLLDDDGVAAGVVPLLTLAFGLLFFFLIYQFGYAIAQGVVAEKESRVVEMLVSAAPIRTLLYGKVLGNGALALLQIALIVAVAAAGAAVIGETALLSLIVGNSGWFLLFFVLGFAMLSCLWAAAGAFASRSDDLQSTTMPLQLAVIAPFFASVYVTDGALRTALSYFPLSAPLVMPGRLVAGEAAAWEGALAAGLLLLTTAATVLVGERLYRASLLRTRGKTSLSNAWSGAEREPAGRR